MLLESGTVLGALCLFFSIQTSHQVRVIDMMPNTFDDQYIGCVAQMEQEMNKTLNEELKNNMLFKEMWESASQEWNKRKLSLPFKFPDKYGTALVLYTMERPYPIYKQLNGNISIAGESKDFYMKNFHFKAFHFYLTRALQAFRRGCPRKSRVYRGMKIGRVSVAKEMRFSQFSSASKDKEMAVTFGTRPFFNILTCFGVEMDIFSVFDEDEILIPVGETFNVTIQSASMYDLKSTGKICSYFNCAYFGAEKRKEPVCTSW